MNATLVQFSSSVPLSRGFEVSERACPWNSDFYFRAWKHYPRTDMITHAGHRVVFPRGVEEKGSSITLSEISYLERYKELLQALRSSIYKDNGYSHREKAYLLRLTDGMNVWADTVSRIDRV